MLTFIFVCLYFRYYTVSNIHICNYNFTVKKIIESVRLKHFPVRSFNVSTLYVKFM